MKNLQTQLFEAVQNLGFGINPSKTADWFYFERPNKVRLGGVKVKANFIELNIDVKKNTTLGRLLNDLIISDKREETNHDAYPFNIYDEESLTKAIDLIIMASSMPQDIRSMLK